MKKIIHTVVVILLIFSFFLMEVSAENVYQNYTYSDSEQKEKEPQAVYATGTLTGEDMGVGSFNSPSDFFLKNDIFYISDTGNNRIVVYSTKTKKSRVINGFVNCGKKDSFNSPKGIFVTDKRELYICDSENNRVVVLDKNFNLISVFSRPDTKLLSKNIVYKPIKIAVDSAHRMYIIAESVNLGIVELDAKGKFIGFFGAINVQYNAFDYFFKTIATDEQKATMQVTVPTECSSLDIDKKGFVFTTVSVFDSSDFRDDIFIRKINPLGNDILQRDGYTAPMGDAKYETDPETKQELTSQFIDVKADEAGIYSALDARYGRIFTYNRQGYLMYVFGGLGDSLGQFNTPVAVECQGNSYYVLDQYWNWITVFSTNQYGSLIKDATVSFDNRDYENADYCWKEALKFTGKSRVAYNQIGSALLKNGDYKEAQKYFYISDNKDNYSLCFEEIRADFIDRYFNVFIIIVLVALLVYIIIKIKKILENKVKGVKR